MQFALDLARSADDASRPDSHLGNEAPNFVVDDFAVSYGNPQTVQVNARRDLGDIDLNYRVNGGRVQTKSTREWRGGLRYGDEGDYWYHRMRGSVTGTRPGDSVKVWFTSEKGHGKHGHSSKTSDSFTYKVRSDSNADVLVLAVEDYSGNSALPPYADPTQPNYLQYYTEALGDTPHDVYDYDAEGRKAPDPLGVLSHFDAVIWYTANDNVTRIGPTPGVADLEAHRTITAVRDFVNEGGRVALQGVNAGRQYDLVEYPQEGFPPSTCDGDLQTTDGGKCQPLSNDFAQYYLGSYVRADGGGLDGEGNVLPVTGLTAPLDGWNATMNGPDSAENHSFARDRDGHAPRDVEHPGPGHLPAVRERAGGRLGVHRRQAVRPALGRVVHDLSEHQRGVQAPAQDDRPDRPRRRAVGRPVVLHVLQHGARLGLRLRGGALAERGRHVNDDWTTLPDSSPGAHTNNETGRQLRRGLVGGAAQPPPPLHDVQPGRNGYAARPPAQPVRGTPRAATPAAGRSGRSTCPQYRGQAGRDLHRVRDRLGHADGARHARRRHEDHRQRRGHPQTDFETDEGGWEIPGAHPEGPSSNLNDWIRSQRIFEDAAVTKTRLRPDVRIRARGRGRGGEPRRPDG